MRFTTPKDNDCSNWCFIVFSREEDYDYDCEALPEQVKSVVHIVHKDYLKNYGHIDDHHISNKIPTHIENIAEMMESIFEGYLEPKEMEEYLSSVGLVNLNNKR